MIVMRERPVLGTETAYVVKLSVSEANLEQIVQESELVFLALPHQKAMEYVKGLYSKEVKIVDLCCILPELLCFFKGTPRHSGSQYLSEVTRT